MFEEGREKVDETAKLKEANIELIKTIHSLQQEKFDLFKLVERNQLAWDNSTDKDMGILPEVYLANRYVIEKWKCGEIYG